MTETRRVQIPIECGPLDLSSPHFAGIGGAGMSALARLLAEQGEQVSGSDIRTTLGMEQLRAVGCRIHLGHRAENLKEPSVVVWSSSIEGDNPELVAARRAGIPTAHRSQVLSQLMNGAAQSVVVGGTHGKSTTTAMLAVALDRRDPSWAGGGAVLGGRNARHGSRSLFIAEGDESDRSITAYRPQVAVVLNVDDDHPETFVDVSEIVEVFRDFVRGSRGLVVSADDPGAQALTALVRDQEGLRVVTFGESEGADVRITSIEAEGTCTWVTLRDLDGVMVTVALRVPGHHNALNAAAAFTAGRVLGVESGELAAGLGRFAGIERRMSLVGTADGVTVRDSFAHHPTAIAADLKAARSLTAGSVVAVFEPCGWTRTAALGPAMGRALAGADKAVLLPVTSTLSSPISEVTTDEIAAAVIEHGGRVHQAAGHAEAAGLLAGLVRPGDLVLTMGTGDVNLLGAQLLADRAATAVS
ncbi:UDP-N-acetylmuramate--L-alanine ligase [Streptomyces sp. NBC_00829]|uniref:UDP-N-acetylmuramate--L-alanine ligase n=1 Tax=Streptomyces sp. NBC_00829 TaxID=2903679 RepID=UPI00386E9B5C|nr:UDP-N-acetylmuramate--L-alanine ligase [Streptomyces sp. NBC_00829]